MKRSILIASTIGALAACTAFAQAPSAPPTRVRDAGIYGCPSHPDILATWPALCPTCRTALSLVQPTAAVNVVPTRDRDDRDRDDRDRDRRFRDEARRREEFRYRPYRGYGYAPRFYGPPPYGYRYYLNRGYYFSPQTGFYYYPNMGYFYSPYTGRYYSYIPGQGYYYLPPYRPGY